MPSIPVLIAMLTAGLVSFSRVFVATRPAWGKLPAWFQTLAPTVLAAIGFIIAGLAHVTTGTDLTVVIVGGLMVLLPGLPSNRSAAPMQVNKPVTGTPSLGDVAVANAMRVGSAPTPPPGPPSPPPAVPDVPKSSFFNPPPDPPAAAIVGEDFGALVFYALTFAAFALLIGCAVVSCSPAEVASEKKAVTDANSAIDKLCSTRAKYMIVEASDAGVPVSGDAGAKP